MPSQTKMLIDPTLQVSLCCSWICLHHTSSARKMDLHRVVAGCMGVYGLKSLPFKIASCSQCSNNDLPWLEEVMIFDQRGK